MYYKTPIERLFDFVFGRKYYAVINERQAPIFSTDIMGDVFPDKMSANAYVDSLRGNSEYKFYQIVSFRSRKRMTDRFGKEI